MAEDKVAYTSENRGYPDEKGVFDTGSPSDHGDAAAGDVQDFSEKKVLKYVVEHCSRYLLALALGCGSQKLGP